MGIRATGLALAACATLTGAIQPVLLRYGAVHLDPLLYCCGAGTVAGLSALIMLFLRGETKTMFDPRYIKELISLSMLGTVVTNLLLVFGLHRINAVPAVLLLQSEPIYSLFLASLLVGERPSLRQLAATAVILGGIGSVFAPFGAFAPAYAAALVLLTPLFWQSAHVIALRLMPPLNPYCIVGARYLFAGVVFVLALLALPLKDLYDGQSLWIVLSTGLLVNFAGSLTWYGAINRLSLAWTTTLVVPGVPMLSTLFALLFLGERASVREIFGVAVAIIGVLLLILGPGVLRKVPAETTYQLSN